MDAPERTPLKREQAERVWIANECKYPHEDACPCMCVLGYAGENARDGLTEYVRADLYAKLEVAEAKQAEKVAALEQERKSTEGALDAYYREVERLRAAIREESAEEAALNIAEERLGAHSIATHTIQARRKRLRALIKPEGEK